jgi:hypothetical protein
MRTIEPCRVCGARVRSREPGDDPELDATDGAHPAWWRGYIYGVAHTVDVVIAMINGTAPSGGKFSMPELNLLAERIASLRASARYAGDWKRAAKRIWTRAVPDTLGRYHCAARDVRMRRHGR